MNHIINLLPYPILLITVLLALIIFLRYTILKVSRRESPLTFWGFISICVNAILVILIRTNKEFHMFENPNTETILYILLSLVLFLATVLLLTEFYRKTVRPNPIFRRFFWIYLAVLLFIIVIVILMIALKPESC